MSALEDSERQERHPTASAGPSPTRRPGHEEATKDVPSGLAAAMVELESELDATKDRWLRAVADLEVQETGQARDRRSGHARGTNLLPSFLPTVDNLERALEVASPD